MTPRVFVTDSLFAFHTDPAGQEGRHSHVWKVTAYFSAAAFVDARDLKKRLWHVLEPHRGYDLPPELWSSENMAKAFLTALGPQCIGIVLERAAEGMGAEFWR
jgi:hypothetical protein